MHKFYVIKDALDILYKLILHVLIGYLNWLLSRHFVLRIFEYSRTFFEGGENGIYFQYGVKKYPF
jgi:hypothetical protein